MMPAAPPNVTKTTTLHSTRTFMKTIVNDAAVMPTDWIMKLKSRAMTGEMPKTRVMIGKATEAPPSEVAPATMLPNTIVTLMYHRGISLAPILPVKRPNWSVLVM